MTSPVSTEDAEIDASVTFSEALMEQINREDVKNMVAAQRDMLYRFEKTNEMLINFNILSANRFAVANNEMKAHTTLMYDMKKDLDSIFKRIRVLKDRLSKSYPDAFKVCNVSPLLEDEEELRVSSAGQTSEDQSRTSSSSHISDNQSGSSANQQEGATDSGSEHTTIEMSDNGGEINSSRGNNCQNMVEENKTLVEDAKTVISDLETRLECSAVDKTAHGQSNLMDFNVTEVDVSKGSIN